VIMMIMVLLVFVLHVAFHVISCTLILHFCFRITSKMTAEKQLFLACITVVQIISHAGRYTVVGIPKFTQSIHN